MTRRAARTTLLVAAGLLALEAGLARGAVGPSRKELLAALPDEDRNWLTEYVAPIILPEEEKLFLELTEPHLRERFKREFWERREVDGLAPEPVRALTAEEIRDRIVHLEPKYRQFLELAGPLLTEDELSRFLQLLVRDKDRFIKEFWKRRS